MAYAIRAMTQRWPFHSVLRPVATVIKDTCRRAPLLFPGLPKFGPPLSRERGRKRTREKATGKREGENSPLQRRPARARQSSRTPGVGKTKRARAWRISKRSAKTENPRETTLPPHLLFESSGVCACVSVPATLPGAPRVSVCVRCHGGVA